MNAQQKEQFSSPQKVLQLLETIETNGLKRAADRALINSQFNGGRPYSDKEVEDNQIQVNVNKLGGYKSAMDANLQVDGALLNKDRFFVAKCLVGPPEKREDYGEIFTAAIHRPLKRGRSGKKHMTLLKNRNRSLTLHGIGGMAWMNDFSWMPKFISLEDWLIPIDATVDMSDDLGHFGINSYLTPYQLFKLTHGENIDPGWNVPMVDKVLVSIPNQTTFTPDILQRPEEVESLLKQHGAFMYSDAVTKIKISFFFYQDQNDGKWYRKVLLRRSDGVSLPGVEINEFLYERDQPFADHIEEICHFQFGDGNVVAPLKFHSVRGLGILLFAIVELDNRMYCQTMQHTFEQLMALLRIDNPAQTDRPKFFDLHSYGVMEPGVSFVPPEERNRADMNMVEFALAQNRQLMQESSSSYVQDIDTGTQKEQTLGEAQIKLQSANKIVGGMLSNIYLYEQFYYEELLRRFLRKNSGDEDVKNFQAECKEKGIPDELMQAKFWEVDVEKVFGMGDQTLAIQEVTSLMGVINQLEPTAQRIVRRKYIATITRNPDLAMRLVPEDEIQSSEGRQAAEDVFATLMRGIEVSFREGIEQQDYVIAMSEMLAQEINRVKSTDNVGTPQDVLGMKTVAADISKHLQLLEQDPSLKAFVVGIDKAMTRMMNDVKAFEQRQQEAAQAANPDPEAMAKIQAEQAKTQAKIENQQQAQAAKLQINQQKHAQQMIQSQERHDQQLNQQREQSNAQVASTLARTQADIEAQKARAAAEPVVV